MKFEGEHLLPGQLGHFFVILGFVSSLIATISFFYGSKAAHVVTKADWMKLAKAAFFVAYIHLHCAFNEDRIKRIMAFALVG